MKKISAALAFLALVCLSLAAIAPQSGYDLFQKALAKERAEGKLEDAIQLYRQIVENFASDRPLAAKALVQIGKCYEKLGRTEARNAYNRILSDFSDQAQQVEEARARLAALDSGRREPRLAKAAGGAARDKEGLTFRKIDFKEAGHSHQARLSPDGSKMLYIGYQDKEQRYDMRVLDFASGNSLTLVEGIDWGGTLIFEWSPDGKKVAFKYGRGELRIVDSEGGKSETLWSAPNKETYVYPLDWSDKNHAILIAIVNSTEQICRLAVLPEKGGEPRTILSGDWEELWDLAQFSPDGKFIVGMKRKEKNTDVYVWTVDGGRETRITDHPADDEYALWSPDGKYIVFVSNRAKTVDLWAVPMAGSRPSGDPIRIQADLGKNKIPTDFTRSGQLLFEVISSLGRPSDLFVLPIDPETGEARGSFRPFAKYPTQAMFYRWSPDGSRIAYTSRKGNIQLPNAYVSSGGTEEDVEVPARGYWMDNVEWSRDGKSLLFTGWNNDDSRVGIFRITLEDQTVEPVQPLGERYGANFKGAYVNIRWLPLAGRYMFAKLLSETEQELYLMDPADYHIERFGEKIGPNGYGIPSPDGRYLVAANFQEKKVALLTLPDGASKVLCALPPEGWPAFSWSPDGKKLVWGEGRWLKMLSVIDGTIQTLVEAGPNLNISGGIGGTPNTAWSPDGTKIAYALQDAAPDSKARAELWIIGATGGSPRKIADAPSSHPLMGGVVWHPSGKTIFVQGQASKYMEGMHEHWVMENFLPVEKR